jgi:hypothetical protein
MRAAFSLSHMPDSGGKRFFYIDKGPQMAYK